MSLLTEFEPAQTLDGSLPAILTCYEAATQTYTQGQVLYGDDSEGTVKEIAANDPATENDVLGIASLDATGTTNTPQGVWILDHKSVFKGTLADGNAPVLTEIWDGRDAANTAGVHSVHESTSTLGHFFIIGVTGLTAKDRVLLIGGHVTNSTESGCTWTTRQVVA